MAPVTHVEEEHTQIIDIIHGYNISSSHDDGHASLAVNTTFLQCFDANYIYRPIRIDGRNPPYNFLEKVVGNPPLLLPDQAVMRLVNGSVVTGHNKIVYSYTSNIRATNRPAFLTD